MMRRALFARRLSGALLAVSVFVTGIALQAQEKTSADDERLARWLKRFPAADANGDGVLSAREAQEFRRKRQEQRQPKRGRKDSGPALTPTESDVAYGDHPRQVVDFFKAASDTPTPVLIFFHGGGFVAGDKSKARKQDLCRQCLESGISVVSANYRFVRTGRNGAPAEPFPGPMKDGARVVQFVRSKAAAWNIDPKRVALSGGSAGAVISLWVGLSDDQAAADSPDQIARFSSRVSAVVSYSGPTSLDPTVILKNVGGNPLIHPSFLPSYGIKSIKELEEPEKRALVELVSPINHASADDPPLYLKHGGTVAGTPLPADTPFGKSIHHARFGQMLKDTCDKLGVRCILSCQDRSAEVTEIDFLKDIFGLKKGQ